MHVVALAFAAQQSLSSAPLLACCAASDSNSGLSKFDGRPDCKLIRHALHTPVSILKPWSCVCNPDCSLAGASADVSNSRKLLQAVANAGGASAGGASAGPGFASAGGVTAGPPPPPPAAAAAAAAAASGSGAAAAAAAAASAAGGAASAAAAAAAATGTLDDCSRFAALALQFCCLLSSIDSMGYIPLLVQEHVMSVHALTRKLC